MLRNPYRESKNGLKPLNLDRLLKPRSIAVVGASTRADSYGCMVMDMLLAHRFPGPIYPINPKREEIRGLTCYPSLSSVPDPIDLIYVALPSSAGPDILEEAGKIGVGGAAIPGNGYADGGPDGEALQDRLVEVATRHGIAICGPNNMGFINYHDRVVAWPTYIPEIDTPSNVALITHSGSVGIALSQDGRALKYAYVIAAGNEANVGAADYLDFLLRDDNVEVVLIFLETIRDPLRFSAAADEANKRGKRIAVIKVGRSETASRMVLAHTGALAGEDALYQAFFDRKGIIRVPDLDTLVETGVLLSSGVHPPPHPGVTLVTLSGGEGALAADLGNDYGMQLPALSAQTVERIKPFYPPFATPRNPIDAYGFGWNAESFEGILRGLIEEPENGTLILHTDSAAEGNPDDGMISEMAEICGQALAKSDKRIVYINNTSTAGINAAARASLIKAGVPVLLGLHEGIRSVAEWVRLSEPKDSPATVTNSVQTLERLVSKPLSETARLGILRDRGIKMVETHPVESPDHAVDLFEQLGRPVVLKGTALGLAHKTEHDLVALNLDQSENVRQTYTRLCNTLAEVNGSGSGTQILLQPMAGDGIELILGATYYPGFGMLIAVGLGGTLVEVIKNVSVDLAPITYQRAQAMLDETPAGTLIRGVRGKGPYDLEAACQAIVCFADFATATGESLKAIEVNPLIVLDEGQGVVGVDAVFET